MQVDFEENFATLAAILAIVEADVHEINTLGKRRKGARIGLLANVVARVHESEDRGRRAQRLLEVVVELRELTNGIVKTKCCSHEREKASGSELAGFDRVAAEQQQH